MHDTILLSFDIALPAGPLLSFEKFCFRRVAAQTGRLATLEEDEAGTDDQHAEEQYDE